MRIHAASLRLTSLLLLSSLPLRAQIVPQPVLLPTGNSPAALSTVSPVPGAEPFVCYTDHIDPPAAGSPLHCLRIQAAASAARALTVNLPLAAQPGLLADIDGNPGRLLLDPTQHIVTTFLGQADGSFTSGPSYSLAGGISSFLLADMDGDGRPDLVAEAANGSLWYFPATPAGFHAVPVPIAGAQDASTGCGGRLIAVADRNHDGLPDLVTANALGISVLLGQAISSALPRPASVQLLGVYDPGQGNATAGRTLSAAADFNSDGNPDLAVDNPAGILVLFGKPDGSFAAPLAVTGSLTASPEPSTYGASFNLIASFAAFAGSSATPTGTVTFSVDGTAVGMVALSSNSAGTASATDTLANPAYARGAHPVTAVYSGDATFASVTFSALHTVAGLRSQTTYSNTTPTIFYGQIADGAGSVIPLDAVPPSTVNGGSISFFADGSLICTLPVNGLANTCPNSAGAGLNAGPHVILATYAGNDFYEPSTSSPTDGAVNVLPDTTTTAVASSLNPAVVGQPIRFTATLAAPYATPSGTASFYDGTVLLATLPLDSNGAATLTLSTLAIGTHSITATYAAATNAATANFNASTSAVLAQIVTAPPLTATSIALASSLNPSAPGQSVTFTATVNSPSGTPSGRVNFTIDGILLNPVALSAGGTASFTTSALTLGVHTLSASFSASSTYAASTSPTLLQQVAAAGAPGFTLTLSPSSLSVPIGGVLSVLITVTPLNGFAQPVTLSCASLPEQSSCAFDSATIPAAGGSTHLRLSAASPHTCGVSDPYFTASGPFTLLDAAATALLMLLLRRRRLILRALTLLLALSVLPAVSGCGGNCTDLGVRPGSYRFTLTGTSTSLTVSLPETFDAHL